MIKTIKKKLIYENKWLKFWEDDIEFPDGDTGIYGYVERKTGGALIIPMTDDNKLVMVCGKRYPKNIFGIGFPIGDKEEGETPLEGAKRELREETGVIAEEWVELGTLRIDPGYNTQQTPVYLARKLSFEEREHDPKEEHEVRQIPLDEIPALIESGDISSGWGLSGLMLLKNYLRT